MVDDALVEAKILLRRDREARAFFAGPGPALYIHPHTLRRAARRGPWTSPGVGDGPRGAVITMGSRRVQAAVEVSSALSVSPPIMKTAVLSITTWFFFVTRVGLIHPPSNPSGRASSRRSRLIAPPDCYRCPSVLRRKPCWRSRGPRSTKYHHNRRCAPLAPGPSDLS